MGPIGLPRNCHFVSHFACAFLDPLPVAHITFCTHLLSKPIVNASISCDVHMIWQPPPRSGHRNCRNVPERFAGTL